jgi:hypothetical protein
MAKAGQSAPSSHDHDSPRCRSGLRPTDRDLPLYRLGICLDMLASTMLPPIPTMRATPPCPTTIACVLTGPHCRRGRRLTGPHHRVLPTLSSLGLPTPPLRLFSLPICSISMCMGVGKIGEQRMLVITGYTQSPAIVSFWFAPSLIGVESPITYHPSTLLQVCHTSSPSNKVVVVSPDQASTPPPMCLLRPYIYIAISYA